MMKERNTGIDVFRIMCCLGVLDYHIMDDVLGTGSVAKVIYFLASFCIPGFFLLSGYLLGEKAEVSIDYCERKAIEIMKKLFGWVIFWTVMHFFITNEIYDIWSQFTDGVQQGGVLPVAWFLFTYCGLMITAFPLHKFMQKNPFLFASLTLIIMFLLAHGFGKHIVEDKTQALWLHIYLGYFMLGMLINRVLGRIKSHVSFRTLTILLLCSFLLSLSIYAFKVRTAAVYMSPHQFYGKWYYTIWLLSLFCLTCLMNINCLWLQTILKRLAENTFVIYLGHLPILLYVTTCHPLATTSQALLFIVIFFIGLELVAEVFRQIPFLRKLV